MKADLDRLMAELGLDAIVVLGDETPNTQRSYLMNGAHASGMIFKKRGEPGIVIVNGMEVDEAAKSGLTVKTMHDFGWAELWEQYKNDRQMLRRAYMQRVFTDLGITGRVGLYGTGEVQGILQTGLMLQDSALPVEIAVGGDAARLFDRLYETKDAQEIAALKESARLTSRVVSDTWGFISQHYTTALEVGCPVINEHGKPLTVGDVKAYIRLRQAELGLEAPEGCIFAQGYDATLPHSQGEDSDVLEVGRAIVFDIFPKGVASGYYHDMTRTWCIGMAPPDVQAIYDDVLHAFKLAISTCKAGDLTSVPEEAVLDYFESKGHPTTRSHPGTMDGYVHSLGHGIGLNVHEAPGFRRYSESAMTPGNVVTIEPGLYYPGKGIGVRIEDAVYFDEDGTLRTLTDFRYDLVLPIRMK